MVCGLPGRQLKGSSFRAAASEVWPRLQAASAVELLNWPFRLALQETLAECGGRGGGLAAPTTASGEGALAFLQVGAAGYKGVGLEIGVGGLGWGAGAWGMETGAASRQAQSSP